MKARQYAWRILFATGLFTNAFALAADPIILRTAITPEDAWLGQKISLRVDVLAKDGWAQLKKIGDPEVHGAYLLRLETQGTRLNETIDGDSYSGQRYEFMLFAQQAGNIVIPPVPVDVEVRRWGPDAATDYLRLATPLVEFDARTPPGAEGIRGLITTSDLTVSQIWQPEVMDAAVGDAIKRTITLRAADVSGMAFTPMLHRDIENLGIYPGEPTVEDNFARGDLTGTRVETVTYVFERPGEFELPGIAVPWWDFRDEALKSIELPGLTLRVSGATATETVPVDQAAPRISTRLIGSAVLALLVAAVVAFRSRGSWIEWRSSRRIAEGGYFRRVLRSLRSGDSAAVLRETMRWLDRINDSSRPARLDEFMRQYGDAGAQAAARDLAHNLSADRVNFDVASLRRGLKAARNNWRHKQRTSKRSAGALPGLNSAG